MQPRRRRCRQQIAQPPTRQQQVGRTRPGKERITDHPQKDLRAGLLRRRVQRCHAQRVDEIAPQCARQRGRQLRDTERRRTLEASPAPPRGGHQQAQPLAPGPALLVEHATHEGQHRRPGRQAQAAAFRVAQTQRRAHEGPLDIDADNPHQAQRLGVGADEDVLAVVEREIAGVDTARPAAELRRHLDERHRVA